MFNEKFLKICQQHSDNNVKSLPENIKQTINFLEGVQENAQFIFTSLSSFKEILEKDSYSAMFLYWKEIDNRIRFLWITMAYKTLSLLKGIVNLINQKNYLSALILTRSLLENAAVFHYYLWKIIPTYNKIMKDPMFQKIAKKEVQGVYISSELEDILILYSHGTNLKEWTELNSKWKQKRIGEYMKFFDSNKEYPEVYKYYSKLCEFVHPNIGTNIIFHKFSYSDNKIEIHSFGREDQNIGLFLETIAYPINVSCEVIREGIKTLKKVKFVNL